MEAPVIEHQKLMELLDYDLSTGLFRWRKTLSNRAPAGSVAGKPGCSRGYATVVIHGRAYQAHKLAIYWYSGIYPYTDVDHIDGDPRNNRLTNLRVCGALGNAQNRHRHSKNNKLGVLGVALCKNTGRYRAQILVSGKKLHLGRFKTVAEASTAYLSAKAKYHIAQVAPDA